MEVPAGITSSILDRSIEERFNELGIIGKSFVSTLQGEFDNMWESVFGRANSLFEKFMQNIVSGFLDIATKNLASNLFGGLLNLIPGGSIFSKLFSGGNSAVTGGGETINLPLTTNQQRPIILTIDGRQVARAMIEPYLDNSLRRTFKVNRL